MASRPTASDFTSFYNFTPSSEHRCIYYKPDKATTCRLVRLHTYKTRACEIYDEINKSPRPPNIGLLEEYVRCNISCTPFRNFEGHRKFVESKQPLLVRELAARWLQEITTAKSRGAIKEEVDERSTGAVLAQSSHVNNRATGARHTTPPATVDPDVTWFIPFHDINPFQRATCIYRTSKGKNCPFLCTDEDNEGARQLFIEFSSTKEVPELGHLMEYAVYNCCRSGSIGAGHQDRLESVHLLKPLAQRWLEEISQQRKQVAMALSAQDSILESSRSAQASIERQPVTPRNRDHAPVPSSEPVSPTPAEPRYNFRPRPDARPRRGHYDVNYSADTLSEFRAHVDDPRESVATKLEKSIESNEPQNGHVYIYYRDSSPGFVKIGYTASSVQARLDDWAKCGYEPQLLYSTDENGTKIPFPKRVETLVHYELFKEWRAERICKMSSCRKSHREWFEISQKRAIEVVRGWVEVMTTVRPYDEAGNIKVWVENFLKDILKIAKPVTAKALLQHYKALQVANRTTDRSADIRYRPRLHTLPLSPPPDSPSRLSPSPGEEYFHTWGSGDLPGPTGPQTAPSVASDHRVLSASADHETFALSDTRKPRNFWGKLVKKTRKGDEKGSSRSGEVKGTYTEPVVPSWPPSPPVTPEKPRVRGYRRE